VAQAAKQLNVVLVLGGTQTLAWASSFYLPAVLADRMAADIGMTSGWFFAAFSAALVVSAIVGPRVGRTVDAIGGREALAASNVVMAFGLITLASAHSEPTLWLAWRPHAEVAAGPVDIAADRHQAVTGAEGLHASVEGINAVATHERGRPISVHARRSHDLVRRHARAALRYGRSDSAARLASSSKPWHQRSTKARS
jgi:hypothetical protein